MGTVAVRAAACRFIAKSSEITSTSRGDVGGLGDLGGLAIAAQIDNGHVCQIQLADMADMAEKPPIDGVSRIEPRRHYGHDEEKETADEHR